MSRKNRVLSQALHGGDLRYDRWKWIQRDSTMIEFKGSYFEREVILWGVVARRISRAKFGLYHPDHAVFLEERTESGRPTPSMRFRTATPMAASVC